MEPNGWVIDLQEVHKTYNRKIRALRGVAIRVGGGEVFGLLGPNGAGKSTLVKIMMTVVRPDRACGTLLGQPLGHIATLRRVGYLPEGRRFPSYLTGGQVLDFYGALSKLPRRERRRRRAYWLDRLGLSKWAGTRLREYSKGMLQRVGIAQALLHEPELVLLDEPTDGIDPLGRRQIREILQELRHSGRTAFINSHILSELEMICDRVAVLVDGQVTRQGTLDQLTAHTSTYQITTTQPADAVAATIRELGGELDHRAIRIKRNDTAALNRIIDALRASDILIESVQQKRWSLEDVFLDAAGRSEDT